jgi:hypothetical protein
MRTPPTQGALLLAGLALALVGLSLQPSAGPAQGQGGGNQGGGTLTTIDLDHIAQRLLQTRSPSGLATADSNKNMIAVTGIDLTGSSVLYLVDTEKKQLAVYQANGGGEPTQSLRLVGARRIDLDLQIEGFNDKSQYTYEELQKRFGELSKSPPQK